MRLTIAITLLSLLALGQPTSAQSARTPRAVFVPDPLPLPAPAVAPPAPPDASMREARAARLRLLAQIAGTDHPDTLSRVERAIAAALSEPPTTVPTTPTPASPKDETSGWFNQFTAGLGALSNGGSGVGLELSTTTRTFRIDLPMKRKAALITHEDGRQERGEVRTPRSIKFMILNRASINLDSLEAVANEYVTSLQAAPITARGQYVAYSYADPIDAAGTKMFTTNLVVGGDLRGVPYANESGSVKLGGTVHTFLKVQVETGGAELNTNGDPIDTGTFYVEPAIMIAFGGNGVMKSLLDNDSRMFAGLDLRAGYKSDVDRFRDFGIVARWTWEKVRGAAFRVGASVTP